MTGTAVQKVDRGTGEVVEVQTFDFHGYLSHLSGTKALQEQQQLAAVYDAACRSLIGPNDVQKEGGREFKKKSAWRKLARHFGISTTVVSTAREYITIPPTDSHSEANEFVATVTVRATAPWGQSAESVGACATDEETGRRTITIADAIATAETRATNRAVSNLIAMGEVSAEEMSKTSGEPRQEAAPLMTLDTIIPFGKHKEKTIRDAGLDYFEVLTSKIREGEKKGEKQHEPTKRFATAALKLFVPDAVSDHDDDLGFGDGE